MQYEVVGFEFPVRFSVSRSHTKVIFLAVSVSTNATSINTMLIAERFADVIRFRGAVLLKRCETVQTGSTLPLDLQANG